MNKDNIPFPEFKKEEYQPTILKIKIYKGILEDLTDELYDIMKHSLPGQLKGNIRDTLEKYFSNK